MYLLRSDQDLVDKFFSLTNKSIPPRRPSISENETEYFIVNQEMICRVLNDHKIIRKAETPSSPSPSHRKGSSISSPSPSTHQQFFSQSLFNENTKNNP